jgi:hypothetical protein
MKKSLFALLLLAFTADFLVQFPASNGRWFHLLLYALPFDLLKQGLVA